MCRFAFDGDADGVKGLDRKWVDVDSLKRITNWTAVQGKVPRAFAPSVEMAHVKATFVIPLVASPGTGRRVREGPHRAARGECGRGAETEARGRN